MARPQRLPEEDQLPTNPAHATTLRLVALLPDDDDEHEDLYGTWHSVHAKKGESCRWERTATEWVVVTLGEGADLGRMIIRDWRGQQQRCESYEAALRLARVWCR